MHRLQNQSTVYRFRIAAFLLCCRCVLVPTSIGVLVYSMVNSDTELTFIGAGLAVVAILTCLLQWMISQRTRCPLCITPVLATRGCSKHRSARKFLGSYRLNVALTIIFKGTFRCPYCYEPTSVEARRRRPRYSRD